jgi:hypothetical protein
LGTELVKPEKTYGSYWKMVEFADPICGQAGPKWYQEQPQVGQAAQSRMKLPFGYLT